MCMSKFKNVCMLSDRITIYLLECILSALILFLLSNDDTKTDIQQENCLSPPPGDNIVNTCYLVSREISLKVFNGSKI